MNSDPEATKTPPSPFICCTVYDRFEGKQHITVRASSDSNAHEEASIAAAERGCTEVVEIVVGLHE